MKAALICPRNRPPLRALAETTPLALLPVMGKPALEYWLDWYVDRGASQVYLLAADGVRPIHDWLAEGLPGALQVELVETSGEQELTAAAVRAALRPGGADGWLPEPADVSALDAFPGAPENPLFESCAGWFKAVRRWMPLAASTPDRIGVRSPRPGVWIGLRSRIARDTVLEPPSWIGEDVLVESGCSIGPGVFLENGVQIARGAVVTDSYVGPDTRVGEFTDVRNSLAWGNRLINWTNGSCLVIDDAFLLCDLRGALPSSGVGRWLESALAATRPGLRKFAGLCQTLRSSWGHAAASDDPGQTCALPPSALRARMVPDAGAGLDSYGKSK